MGITKQQKKVTGSGDGRPGFSSSVKNCSQEQLKQLVASFSSTMATAEKQLESSSSKFFIELSLLPEADRSFRVELELFQDQLPKACQNFAQLCQGTVDKHGRTMCYKDSIFHEIIPGWVLVGGDFVNNNGSGGKAIFDEGQFDDESFAAADYSQPGLICMLSHGPNTNSSIFFITLKPAEWLNGLHVAFGRVTSDLAELQKLAEEAGSKSGIPTKTVKITACGRLA